MAEAPSLLLLSQGQTGTVAALELTMAFPLCSAIAIADTRWSLNPCPRNWRGDVPRIGGQHAYDLLCAFANGTQGLEDEGEEKCFSIVAM